MDILKLKGGEDDDDFDWTDRKPSINLQMLLSLKNRSSSDEHLIESEALDRRC